MNLQTCYVTCLSEEVYSNHIKGKKHAKVYVIVAIAKSHSKLIGYSLCTVCPVIQQS